LRLQSQMSSQKLSLTGFNITFFLSLFEIVTLSGEVHQMEGRFALKSPWWEVKCSVKRVQRDRLIVVGFPSYKLRSNLDKREDISLVSLFLNACQIAPQFIKEFFTWLPPERGVSLNNLFEVLDEFSEGGYANQANVIKTQVSKSGRCTLYLPTIYKDTEEEDTEEKDTSLLAKLEHIIANNVWKLGFNKIVSRELKLVRCEAQLQSFKNCNLFDKIPAQQRNGLLAYDKLKRHNRTGSTYWEISLFSEALRKDLVMSHDAAGAAIEFLVEQDVVVYDKGKVVLSNNHLYETGIAECLHSLVERDVWNIPVNATEVLYAAEEKRQQKKIQNCQNAATNADEDDYSEGGPSVSDSKDLPVSPTNGETQPSDTDANILQAQSSDLLSPIKLDQDHVRAAEMICANPVTVISGKAGCGKTTVVSQLLKAAVEQSDLGPHEDSPTKAEHVSLKKEEILLTAPTGRAASLLKKKTSFPAFTLHQVLYSFMHTKTEEIPESWKFKDVRVLVVDEGSMVCVQILHSVLGILLSHANLQKFIILGDIRQLPSIQPGNVLPDLFNSLKPVRWAIEMRTNHRAESELIVKNAGRIADMGMKYQYFPLDFDVTVDLENLPTSLPPDKRFILIRLPVDGPDDALQTAVHFLIKTAPGLTDHKTSQFIAFKRNDVALINDLCCKHYNDHRTKNHKKKLHFQPGDKVCCTKNGYLDEGEKKEQQKTEETDVEKKEKLRLCNGEIFFIIGDDTSFEDGRRPKRYLTLDGNDGRIIKLEYRELQRECKLRHAWARTIHTYQGSENETIVYVVGDGIAQTWKHIYTAVTRGQKRVYVVTDERAIEAAIKRHETPRTTRLSGLVKDQLVQLGMHPKTPIGTPSGCSPHPSTPLHSQTPGLSVQPLQRKRLCYDDKEKSVKSPLVSNMNEYKTSPMKRSDEVSAKPPAACEEVEQKKQMSSATTPLSSKRVLPGQQQEVEKKKPRLQALISLIIPYTKF
uniref:Helicase (DNA) B n=1 Tax=Sphaeramia orbicularis TaxID=375764 RepID=A0A672YWJ4_9TELE